MDALLQRLAIAQELVQNLVNLHAMPLRPTHDAVQAVLNAADTKLKMLDSATGQTPVPLVVPSLVPNQTTTVTTKTTTSPAP